VKPPEIADPPDAAGGAKAGQRADLSICAGL
jgi:hypothetical protein